MLLKPKDNKNVLSRALKGGKKKGKKTRRKLADHR